MKNEQVLIKKREERRKQIKGWYPNSEEMADIYGKAWARLMKDYLEIHATKPEKHLRIVFEKSKYSKYYEGMTHLFGEYLGAPKSDKGLIIIYIDDILQVNYFQKDLFKDHLYFILLHEVRHWMGETHETMGQISEFNYPEEKKIKK